MAQCGTGLRRNHQQGKKKKGLKTESVTCPFIPLILFHFLSLLGFVFPQVRSGHAIWLFNDRGEEGL